MSEYYDLQDLLRNAQYILNDLKKVDQKIELELELLEEKEPKNFNQYWHKGHEDLRKLQQISQILKKKQIDENTQLSLLKLNENILNITKSFEDHLRKIQEQNYMTSNINVNNQNRDDDDLQQQLLVQDYVNPEQIYDQTQITNERQQNIEDITLALSEIKNMTKEIKQSTQHGGERLQNVQRQQDKHLHNLNNKINVDLTTTEQYQSNMISRICWWGLLIVLLMISVLMIIYFLK